MTGFVYKWTNIINGRWYIGSHKGTIDDGYRHTSKVVAMAEQKHGIENFVREILYIGDYDADNIRLIEGKLLSKNNAARNKQSYNLTNIIGTNCHTEEANASRKEKLTGRILTAEQCRKNARKGNTNGKGNKGKTHSKETKAIMSLKGLGNTNGKSNKGKPWSAKKRASYEARYKITAEIVQDFPV